MYPRVSFSVSVLFLAAFVVQGALNSSPITLQKQRSFAERVGCCSVLPILCRGEGEGEGEG